MGQWISGQAKPVFPSGSRLHGIGDFPAEGQGRLPASPAQLTGRFMPGRVQFGDLCLEGGTIFAGMLQGIQFLPQSLL